MIKYYYRRRSKYTGELYSVIYLHKNIKAPVSYDVSWDLNVNRVNDLCKNNKWEI